jgi:hypothetical protein
MSLLTVREADRASGDAKAAADPQLPAAGARPTLLFTGTHTSPVYSAVFSPDGRRLASATNREIKLWDVPTGKELVTIPLTGTNVYGLAFSPDGKRLAVSISRLARVLDAATGQELFRLQGQPHFLFRLAFSPDGKTLASAGGSTGMPGEARLWDAATGNPLRVFNGHGDPVLNVVYSADGRRLASSSGGTTVTTAGEIKVWDPATGRELLGLQGHPDNVYGLSFSPDGRRLASGGGVRGRVAPGTLKVWELASGAEAVSLAGHAGPVFNVAFSPDGKHLASAGGDKVVKVWNFTTGRETATIAGHTAAVYQVAFSPDGRRLVSAGDQTVRLWDITALTRPAAAAGGAATARDVEAAWTDLASADAAQAYRALATLVGAPALATTFLAARLEPVPALTPAQQERLTQLLAELDHDRFTVRERAAQELRRFGEAAVAMLQRALAGEISLEVRRRVARILAEQMGPARSPDRMRDVRAIEVLEHIGTPEALQVLQCLAGGQPEAGLTREAVASVERLTKRRAP